MIKPLRRRYWFVRYVLAPPWRHYMQAGVEAAARVAEDSEVIHTATQTGRSDKPASPQEIEP